MKMNIMLPESFKKKFIALISNNQPFYGRSQASFMAGNYEGVEEFLKTRSEEKDNLKYSTEAKPLYEEFIKLQNYSQLRSHDKLSVEQFCDLFLQRVYDVSREEGLTKEQTSNETAGYFGIDDYMRIQNIFEILIDTGMIKIFSTLEDGNMVFFLTGKGEHYIETGGKTGIIKTYLSNSNSYIDNSVNVQTNYGQAFSGSSNVSQNISINNLHELIPMLNEAKNILKVSNEKDDIKEDGLLTINSIETELKKKNPILSVIKDGLSYLSKIASIANFVKSFYAD